MNPPTTIVCKICGESYKDGETMAHKARPSHARCAEYDRKAKTQDTLRNAILRGWDGVFVSKHRIDVILENKKNDVQLCLLTDYDWSRIFDVVNEEIEEALNRAASYCAENILDK